MRASKRDRNERTIIDALEKVGALVTQMWTPAPFDLLVGFRSEFYALEVKAGDLDRLTRNEAEFQRQCLHYELPYAIVRSVRDAYECIGLTFDA